MITKKLSHWDHEREYRLIVWGDRDEIHERKLRYRISDLQGVIFGINASRDDKLAIVRTLVDVAAAHCDCAIEFGQAAFSEHAERIEIRPLPLLSTQFDQLVVAQRQNLVAQAQ